MPEALRLFLPNRAGWFFVLLLALFFFGRPVVLLRDGDICRHLLTGLYLFQHHVLPTTNYICALAPDTPWLTNSSAADVSYAAVYQWWGLNGVSALAAVAIAWSLTASYQIGRLRGLGPMIGLLLLCVSASISSMHWLARPHVLTYVLFISYYYLVFVSKMKPGLRCAVLAVITLIWANTHGSFYLGLGMLACKILGDLLQGDGVAENNQVYRAVDSLAWGVGTLAAAVLASSINTRGGAGFLSYIWQYMGSSAVANSEWRNIDFTLGAPVWCFVGLCLFTTMLLAYSPAKPRLGELAYALVIFCFSLYAMRIMPYFGLLMLPAIAPLWSAFRDGIMQDESADRRLGLLKRLLAIDMRADKQEPDSPRLIGIWCAASAILIGCFVALPQLKLSDFDPEKLPVGCTNYIKQHNLAGLGFTQDNWASYLYWKTGHQIFIDDYTDLYPPQLVRDYTTIYFTYPDWPQVIKKYNFQYVLLPRGLPLTQLLIADGSWTRVCEDPAAILFEPKPSAGK